MGKSKRSKCSSIGKSVGIGVVGRCYVGDDCVLYWKGFWKAAGPSLKAQKRSSKESVVGGAASFLQLPSSLFTQALYLLELTGVA